MIYRVVVTGKAGGDGASARTAAREAGVQVDSATASRVFFLDTPDDASKVRDIALVLLADPIEEHAEISHAPSDGAPTHPPLQPGRLEIHLKPGVMDPVAASTEMALRQAGLHIRQVRTGRSFLFSPPPNPDQLRYLGGRVLGNAVIEAVHLEAWLPTEFPKPRTHPFELRRVMLRDLDDAGLTALSRSGHLFLNLTEMKAIQAWYREQGREPTDIELETLAQTWSEHCVHKTLKSAVEVTDPVGGNRKYTNLIKETIFASTQQLIAEGKGDFCLSVFKDNAGVIAFDDTDAVCFKVETHNRPSAIDPYGGAATGAGGCIRDVLGTGLGAKPIANTDVFCVAFPNNWQIWDLGFGISDLNASTSNSPIPSESPKLHSLNPKSQIPNPKSIPPSPPHPQSAIRNPQSLPPGVLHPKRTLTQVVAGVRDYGNRMGIPTINGAVYFDDRYVANPLVFCGCVGLLPRTRIFKAASAGDAIVVIGGRTGRDGIHGATFSSAELTSTHADEFSHAVQIGNAITQKKMMDVVLQAADRNLFSAITDCGAGGLSSAVGEMGEKLGAEVHLDRVPLKYEGLRYDEIWISEAQERMVLSVSPHHVQSLLDLAKSEDVEATVIGHFGTENRELRLHYSGTEVGRLGMHFLHDGIPMPVRRAVIRKTGTEGQSDKVTKGEAGGEEGWWTHVGDRSSIRARLLALLAHPNIASKHFIVRQYDHEVQGMSVVKPLVGPLQRGPSDGSVLRPKASSKRGVAVSVGLSPWTEDPYEMALAAIDEAVRNVVAVGGDPDHTAILDNFCWPGTDNEEAMGDLVRTAEACRDAALAYRIPFISGKDSLHNQYTNKTTGHVTRIPNTLLISAISIVPDLSHCLTMDLKRPGNTLWEISAGHSPNLHERAELHRRLAALIRTGKVLACHDVSDGGWLTAAAEMSIASNLGLTIDPTALPSAFTERLATYLIETPPTQDLTSDPTLHARRIAEVTPTPELSLPTERTTIEDLTTAWHTPLDW